jgi:hypothetical protein
LPSLAIWSIFPDARRQRFPPEIVDAVRVEIERRIARHTEGCSKTSAKGFASLARGGDILSAGLRR